MIISHMEDSWILRLTCMYHIIKQGLLCCYLIARDHINYLITEFTMKSSPNVEFLFGGNSSFHDDVMSWKCFLHSWWRHQMETFSTLLAFCAGNSPVPGEFPAQRPVTQSFDVFFDLHLNKWLSKHSEAGDFRCHHAHYDVIVMLLVLCNGKIHLSLVDSSQMATNAHLWHFLGYQPEEADEQTVEMLPGNLIPWCYVISV